MPGRLRLAGTALVAAALALAGARSASAQPAPPRLEVAGQASTDEDGLVATLTVANLGADAATALKVRGELGPEQAEASAPAPLPGGSRVDLPLRFAAAGLGAGVHALTLTLEYAPASRPAETQAQRAYVLLSAGAAAPAPLALTLDPLSLLDRGEMVARLRSTDGRPHLAALRLVLPRGLQAPEAPSAVQVPATGEATARVDLLRGGAPRPSTQGVVALAEWDEDGLHQSAGATGTVTVLPDPAWLPRLRPAIGGAAAGLLAAAAVLEGWRAWRGRRGTPAA